MPVCLRSQYLVNYGTAGRVGDGKVVVGTSAGVVITPQVFPAVPVVSAWPNGMLEGCDIVGLSPSDFANLSKVAEVNQATNAYEELGNMSIENAQVISAYIAVVWAIAWGFRALRSAVVNYYESSQNE